MKIKFIICAALLCISTTVFAQTRVYSNNIYGTMTVTFSQGSVYAVQGNMAVTFYYKSYICGILNYHNPKYGTLLINESCLSFVMLNNRSVMFYYVSSSGGSYSSSKNNYSSELCYTCHGTGRCTVCKGSGIYSNYGYSDTCSACSGTGKCWHCYGSGKQ